MTKAERRAMQESQRAAKAAAKGSSAAKGSNKVFISQGTIGYILVMLLHDWCPGFWELL